MAQALEIKVPQVIEQAIEQMPAISPIFNKLREMAHKLEVEPTEIIKVIMIDPVLSGKVIRLVNSAYYGLRSQVNSLAQAVVMLGLNTVKNLTMYTAVLDKIMVSQKNSPLDPKAFWYHCLSTAVGCKMLAQAQEVSPLELETHFLAGLLHDLGKVVYIKAVPEAYQEVLIDCKNKVVSLDSVETAHFGFSHAQLGGMLARKWKLDTQLIEVIEQHHSPESLQSQSLLLQRLIVTNNFCKRGNLGQSGNPMLETFNDALIEKLQITPQILQSIDGQLPQEIEKAIKFLGLKS